MLGAGSWRCLVPAGCDAAHPLARRVQLEHGRPLRASL